MSQFDFDSFPEGEWDDRGELAWNEFDWEQFLREQDSLLSRYNHFYLRCREFPDRLDRVARLMGWDSAEWATFDASMDDEAGETDPLDLGFEDAEQEQDEDMDPYTIHRHPIYIATKSLYQGLTREYESISGHQKMQASAMLGTRYLCSLQRGESHAMFAVNALDLGDYALTVCLFKRALAEINLSLNLLGRIAAVQADSVSAYHTEALCRLFDLREVWLRVMQFCREESERRIGDDE